jgi:hypothetical protein
MYLLVIEGPIWAKGSFIDLSYNYFESIHFDMEEDGHKKPDELYADWLRANPLVERIDNPAFFIGCEMPCQDQELP